MPYITRNKKGEIKSIYATPPPRVKSEWVDPEKMDEVLSFLNTSEFPEHGYAFMDSSDIELIRVLEDLIDLLCDKHIIVFTELPEFAQNKLAMRKRVRENMGVASLIDEEEKGIF